MKYFEFNSAEYYALIGAKDIDTAMDYYDDVVAELDENDAFPDEITKRQAKLKLIKSCEENRESVPQATSDFEVNSEGDMPFIVLIDGSLM